MGLFDNLREALVKSLQGDIEQLEGNLAEDTLEKGMGDNVPLSPQMNESEETIGQRAYLTDPYFDYNSQQTVYKSRASKISYRTLKDASLRDWVVSAIIQARCDTMLRFARPQAKHLDMGFKIKKKSHLGPITHEEREFIENLEDFLFHCGRKEGTPQGEEMLFGEFLKLCTRDALTFGHIAVEKILTMGGALHRFRPVPADSMYLVNNRVSRELLEQQIGQSEKMREQTNQQSKNIPANDQEFNTPDISYYKYVQLSTLNQVLTAWGDEDMIWLNANAQNFADLNGYCYSALELAVINVTRHMDVETYNAKFFTNGYAARGLLHLKGTVTQAQLTAFRRQFYNTINGTQNAWRTPIVAGLDEVQWIPISGTAKEMEYLNYNNHLMRAICSQFQVDPLELGLDYLISGQGRASSSAAQNNEAKINYSRERGLLPILLLFEDMVNSHIFPAIDPDISKMYEFRFTGIDEESAQVFLSNQQAAMTVYSSLNDLFKEVGKSTIQHPVADLPLNQSFWALVEKNMTRGEIREYFLGDTGASTRKELAYIPADPAFLSWNQLIMTIDQQKKMEQQQAQQAQQQQEMMDQQKQQQVNEQAHNIVHHQNLRDTAKQFGATSATHVGGTTMKNPINSIPEGGGGEEPK